MNWKENDIGEWYQEADTMGCDIHFFVERYRPKLKRWTSVRDPLGPCPAWACDGKVGFNSKCSWCKGTGKCRQSFYEGRNYSLFAMLAGVRNERANPVTPIAEPRGLPKDISSIVRAKSDRYGEDGHSHSWLMLSELLDVNYWDKIITHHGYVDLRAYEKWKADQSLFPGSWCGGVGGGGTQIISEKKARVLLGDKAFDAEERLRGEGRIYVEATWQTKYRDSSGGFMKTIEELKKLDKNPEHVRIVFFFDN